MIFSESLANNFFAKGALGIRRSSFKANIKKKRTRIHGKILTMGSCMNLRSSEPIAPAKVPMRVKEEMRARL